MRGRALYPYSARDKTEISFQVGDQLLITIIGEDGWYTGECRQQFGLFPGNYVKIEETQVPQTQAVGGNDLIIKSLEDEMAKLRVKLEEETRQRQESEQRNANLEQRLQSAQEQLAAAAKQKDDLDAQSQTLQQRLQAIRQHEQEQVTSLQTQLGEAQAELAGTKSALEEAQRTKCVLQNEVEEFRALLNSQVQGAMDQSTSTQSLEALTAEVGLLRTARAAGEKIQADLQQALADVQAKTKDLAAKASAVEMMRKQVAKLRKCNAILEKELSTAVKESAASVEEAQRLAIYSKGLEEESNKLWKQIQDASSRPLPPGNRTLPL